MSNLVLERQVVEKPFVLPEDTIETPKERTLRVYQRDIVSECYKHWAKGVKSILNVLVGGGGKTTVAAWIMRDRSCSKRAKKAARSVFLVERNCLLNQAKDTLIDLGIDCSIIQGSRKVKWEHQCMVASLQTLRSIASKAVKHLGEPVLKVRESSFYENLPNDNPLKTAYLNKRQKYLDYETIAAPLRQQALKTYLGTVGLFVLDEAHDGVGQQSYNDLVAAYKDDPKCFHLGLTATPWRLKSDEYLGLWFEKMVTSLQPPDAVAAGWLCGERLFSQVGVFDRSSLDTGLDGDYNLAQLAKQGMRPEALKLVVDKWIEFGENNPTIVFCATVKQAIAQSDYFNQRGIPSIARSGNTPTTERKRQDTRIYDGSLKVICSVDTDTKGWDCPPIATVVISRVTKSKSKFDQMCFRGSRRFKGNEFLPAKNHFVIIDCGGHLDDPKMGNPMAYQNYDISKPPERDEVSDTSEIFKECPNCKKQVITFAKVCTCGHEFGDKEDYGTQETIFDPSAYVFQEWFDAIGCERIQTFRSRKIEAYKTDLHPDTAVKEFQAKYGFIPPNDWHLFACCGKRSNKATKDQYKLYLEKHLPHFSCLVGMRLEFGDKHTKQPDFLAKWDQPWWEVLGCDRKASKPIVKTAYLQLSKQWHPDICSDRENAENQMKILNKAWDEFKVST